MDDSKRGLIKPRAEKSEMKNESEMKGSGYVSLKHGNKNVI